MEEGEEEREGERENDFHQSVEQPPGHTSL